MIVSLAFLTILTMPILEKYQNSKTITTVETTNYPICNIDFPGITVCSNVRVSSSLFNKALKNSKLPWKNLTEENVDYLYDIHAIVRNLNQVQNDPSFSKEAVEVMRNYSDYIPGLMAMVRTVCTLIHASCAVQITPSCSRMFLYCKWQGKRVDCDKVVTQRKTDSGFCCSFNTIDMAESYDLTEEDLAEEKTVYSCPGKVVKNV